MAELLTILCLLCVSHCTVQSLMLGFNNKNTINSLYFLCVGLTTFVGNLKLNRIRDQIGPFSSSDVTNSLSKLEMDVS